MKNKKQQLNNLKEKLTAAKLKDEITQFYNIATSQNKQNEFNEEMVQKTRYYQQKYGFETNLRKGHEFWNVEADAFKHTFGSAKMYFDMGEIGSILGGISHEDFDNNPENEWNMDSWNNEKGRQIGKEIKKEYGKKFYDFSPQKQDDIIAEKVMQKMRNGELITTPNDKRKFQGNLERKIYDLKQNMPTGHAAPIEDSSHIFTPEEIGNMSSEEFLKNESLIMNQLKNGQIKNSSPNFDYGNYKNPQSGKSMIFTREDVDKMSTKEYSKNEQEIMAQAKTIGMPFKKDLPKNVKTYTDDTDGKWVTINGNHVLIKD